MKASLAIVAVAVLAWLGLWVSNTGILKTRDCRYLVGVTVAKRLQPIADRCPLIRTVGS